jgi:hypothetical protein
MAANAAGLTVFNMVQNYYMAADWKAMLVGSTYTFDPDTHQFRANVTGEVSGDGYTAGGTTLTGTAVTHDPATNRVYLKADSADFGVVTLAGVTQVVVYMNTGSAATDRVISVHTFAAQSPTGVNFAYAWNAGNVGYFVY